MIRLENVKPVLEALKVSMGTRSLTVKYLLQHQMDGNSCGLFAMIYVAHVIWGEDLWCSHIIIYKLGLRRAIARFLKNEADLKNTITRQLRSKYHVQSKAVKTIIFERESGR